MFNSYSISGKVILITGASTGIGASLAETLAKQYPDIKLVLAARNQTKLETVANNCRQQGTEVLVVPTDLTEPSQVKALAEQALNHFGTVDILVNNAGYGQMGPIELIPTEAVQRQFAVNFHGALTLTQALIPVMRNQGSGRIVNVSSLGGRIPFPVAGMYSCSKFALEALSDVLRMELKTFNIKVIVIEPGPVVTDFFRVAWSEVQKTIPHHAETPYAPVFKNIEAIDSQLELLGWSAEKTARKTIQAIAKNNPRPRYILATGGNMLVFLMTKVLPTSLRDTFWKRFYGVHKIQKDEG
ncbi:Short-chain dehydrogenase/reductase SDR [Hyella patelloides LEGE 07179]|uniref:Short-chain dehydrogenase/reductase SDR n=1 Tax=Hyella patelloides LEGE 07179 TaxID=945734 RepID=A0A563VJL1_9CYAN|nr:SDR family oxidoreductase [Hyella patelloides]VEP11624.1 Short-chain dehydrogenase/reductase SDR [Hyella patelloides LEGE 07179]